MGSLRARFIRKLTEAFADKGIEILLSENDIYPATGAWRTNYLLDVYRWQAHYRYRVSGDHWLKDSIGSYCTMTECAKGMVVARDSYGWEAHSYSATHDRNAIDIPIPPRTSHDRQDDDA